MLESMIDSLYINRGLYYALFVPVCSKYKLTMTEMLVLLYLAKNQQCDTASGIVDRLKITKSHISASVRDLEERGYLQGSYMGHDRRTIHLRLCDEAAKIVREGNQVQQEFLSVVSRGFSEEEIKTFGGYLERINANVEDYLQNQLHSKRG